MADESLPSAIVKRLRNQPFLFVLGIAALLIALLTSGAGLGTPEFRLILAVIAGLALLVVVGYYLQRGRSARAHESAPAAARGHGSPRSSAGREPAVVTDAPSPTYNVSAQGAVIGAIGPHATVTVGSAAPPPAPPVDASPAAAEELERARRALARLESKRALYAAGTEPRELLDEIARAQRRIGELGAPRRGAAPPAAAPEQASG
jgi:hypothetical protein